MPDQKDCPFCERVIRRDYEESRGMEAYRVVRFAPLNPVVPGHMLFVPAYHFQHPAPETVGTCMNVAERYALRVGMDFNLITSSGSAATQTIAHLHVHYVPREPGDGLLLPWSAQ